MQDISAFRSKNPHLVAVREAHQELERAKRAYYEAIMAAKKHGVANIRIAEQCGMTEGGVRMFLKRNPELGYRNFADRLDKPTFDRLP